MEPMQGLDLCLLTPLVDQICFLQTGTDPGGGLGPLGSKKIFFLVIIFLIFVVRPPSKTLILFFHNKPNQSHPNSNYLTKKLNKNNKNIHNGGCILAKNKKLFYHQRTKKLCVIGEAKTKFSATAVNQYKYQLIVVSC